MKVLEHVLVIDFDEQALASTTALFEHYGFVVVPAGSIDDVLGALEPGAPRVIVMEPVLPERDGFELCRSILDSCIGTRPVVVLASTRIAGHEPHFRAKEVGAHMFIERPKQDEMLLQAVTTVMQVGGHGPNSEAPGRVALAAKRAAEDTPDTDAPAPVLDDSFADWVEQTFTPDAGDAPAATDELELDSLDSLDSLSSVVEVSSDTAEAMANRAAVLVSDAMRPKPEPRRWGGMLAVGLAVALTVGGAAAWLLLGRDAAALSDPAVVELPTTDPRPVVETSDAPDSTSLAIEFVGPIPDDRSALDAMPAVETDAGPLESGPVATHGAQPSLTAAAPARKTAPPPDRTPMKLTPIAFEPQLEPIVERIIPAATTDETLIAMLGAIDPPPAFELEPETQPEPAPQRVIVEPSLVRRIAPRYPPAARNWGRGGRVVLRAVVGVDGALSEIEIETEPVRQLGFGRAAVDAVKQWQYRPATLDGIPFERPITIEVTFRP